MDAQKKKRFERFSSSTPNMNVVRRPLEPRVQNYAPSKARADFGASSVNRTPTQQREGLVRHGSGRAVPRVPSMSASKQVSKVQPIPRRKQPLQQPSVTGSRSAQAATHSRPWGATMQSIPNFYDTFQRRKREKSKGAEQLRPTSDSMSSLNTTITTTTSTFSPRPVIAEDEDNGFGDSVSQLAMRSQSMPDTKRIDEDVMAERLEFERKKLETLFKREKELWIVDMEREVQKQWDQVKESIAEKDRKIATLEQKLKEAEERGSLSAYESLQIDQQKAAIKKYISEELTNEKQAMLSTVEGELSELLASEECA